MGTDTTSWPSEFSELKKLDVLLKCGICYDYMSTCMMTSCSHNYCSLCIRKFMQYKTQCPTCFEETHEVSLRNNRPLDEIIMIYSNIKERLLRTLRLAAVSLSGNAKEFKGPPEPDPLPLPSGSSTPKNTLKKNSFFSPSLEVTPPPKKSNTVSCQLFPVDSNPSRSSEIAKIPDSENDEVKQTNFVKVPVMFHSPKTNTVVNKQPKPKPMALCPVCQVEIPAKNINVHLDACLARSNGEVQPRSKPKPKRDPLPKRLYNLMADKDLKKNLKEYGLNTQGDRKALVTRLQRFTVLYNSENDAANPRSTSELIMQLEREEREEKKTNSFFKSFHAKVNVDRKAPADVIEKSNKQYLEENKDNFKTLIENMRNREGQNIKPLKPVRRVESDDEVELVDEFNAPSTSYKPVAGNQISADKVSIYSQDTIPEDDPDEDIFLTEPKERNEGQIDWNRTLNIDSESEEVGKRETITRVAKKKTKEVTANVPLASVLDQEDGEAYTRIFPETAACSDLVEGSSSDSSFFETVNKSGASKKTTGKFYSRLKRDFGSTEMLVKERSISPMLFDDSININTEDLDCPTRVNGRDETVLCPDENFNDDATIALEEENDSEPQQGRRRSKRKIVKKDNPPLQDGPIQTRTQRKRHKISLTDT